MGRLINALLSIHQILSTGDFVPDAYPIVNFNSLVEAILDLIVVVNRKWDEEEDHHASDNDPISSNPTNLIRALRNVQLLKLESPAMFETLYFFREAIPVFERLHHLTIIHHDWTGRCLRSLPFLLNKTPKLKTLHIMDGLHYNEEEPGSVCECLPGYSFLLSCPVEVLEITVSS